MSITVSPESAGNVNPASGTFNDGELIEIQASPNSGWSFTHWSGDIPSDENPLIVEVVSNLSLTANFTDIRQNYEVELKLVDDIGSIELLFGLIPQFNERTMQAPPPPPDGALNAWFDRDGEELIRDYRAPEEEQSVWTLHYEKGEDDNLSLEWHLDITVMDGTLILSDSDGSVEIDMQEQSTWTLPEGESGVLEVRYVPSDS